MATSFLKQATITAVAPSGSGTIMSSAIRNSRSQADVNRANAKRDSALKAGLKEALGDARQAQSEIDALEASLAATNIKDAAEEQELRDSIARAAGAIAAPDSNWGVKESFLKDLPPALQNTWRKYYSSGSRVEPGEAIQFLMQVSEIYDDRLDALEDGAKIVASAASVQKAALRVLEAQLRDNGYIPNASNEVMSGGAVRIGSRVYPLRLLLLSYVLGTATKPVIDDGTFMPNIAARNQFVQETVALDTSKATIVTPAAPGVRIEGFLGMTSSGLQFVATDPSTAEGQPVSIDNTFGFQNSVVVYASADMRQVPDLKRLALLAAAFGIGEQVMSGFGGSLLGTAGALSADGITSWIKNKVL